MKAKLTLIKKTKLKGEDGYVTFSIRIPEKLKERLAALAGESNQSRNAVIIQFLEFGCDNVEIIESSSK